MASPSGSSQRGHCFSLRFQENESLTDARNVLLIVAALIAAVTFQAGVNPPGGIWQDSSGQHKAGRAIYADQKEAFYVFLIANTLAFSTATLVIISLTYKFHFYIEVWAAALGMVATYASAIFAITPHESFRFRFVLGAGVFPFALQLGKNAKKKMFPRSNL